LPTFLTSLEESFSLSKLLPKKKIEKKVHIYQFEHG
jgi:hypothetical protein